MSRISLVTVVHAGSIGAAVAIKSQSGKERMYVRVSEETVKRLGGAIFELQVLGKAHVRPLYTRSVGYGATIWAERERSEEWL